MSIFSYIITRDYGFAPNPFYNICTLATCKPYIRKKAMIGDWVLGFGSAAKGSSVANKLIVALQVEKVMTFDEYWNSDEFYCKRSFRRGSKKQKYGDNIYHHNENGVWIQEPSHHSKKDGTIELKNLNRDTKTSRVLISRKYWYWGKEAILLPECLQPLIHSGIGQSSIEKANENSRFTDSLECWLNSLPQPGYIAEPANFYKEFEIYDGE